MKNTEIDIETFSSFEDIDKFCEVQEIDLIWEFETLFITKREC